MLALLSQILPSMRKYTHVFHEAYTTKEINRATASAAETETKSQSVVFEFAEESYRRWMNQM